MCAMLVLCPVARARPRCRRQIHVQAPTDRIVRPSASRHVAQDRLGDASHDSHPKALSPVGVEGLSLATRAVKPLQRCVEQGLVVVAGVTGALGRQREEAVTLAGAERLPRRPLGPVTLLDGSTQCSGTSDKVSGLPTGQVIMSQKT